MIRKDCLSKGLDKTTTQQMLLLLALSSKQLKEKGFFSHCVDNHIDLYKAERTWINKNPVYPPLKVYEQEVRQGILYSSVKKHQCLNRQIMASRKHLIYILLQDALLCIHYSCTKRHWSRKVAIDFEKWLCVISEMTVLISQRNLLSPHQEEHKISRSSVMYKFQ